MKNTDSLKEELSEDLKMQGIDVSSHAGIFKFLRHTIPAFIFLPSFACIVCYRINRRLYKKSRIIGRLFHAYRYYVFANDISFFAEIGPGCHLAHTTGIVIGRGVVIGRNSKIYQNVTLGAKHFEKPNEKPVIGNNVTIGAGSCVLGNITIGSNTEIGALTFCDQSVPDNSVAYGRPLTIKQK